MRATVALLCLCLFFLLATDVWAAAEISDLKVTVDGDRALVSLKLERAFTTRLWERVDSGLPTAIVYRFLLEKDRKRWYDVRLKETTFEAAVTWDAVGHLYTVHYMLDGKLVESRTFRDAKSLAAAMTRLDAIPVFTLEKIPRDWRLLVKARAELGAKTVLSLVPVAVATEWVESKKFYPPGGSP